MTTAYCVRKAARRFNWPDPDRLSACRKPGSRSWDLHEVVRQMKQAEGLTSPSSSDFSRAFASLALASMQNNPKFIENLVGFQLLERSDDDARAVGMFAAQIHGMTFYVIAIFSDGRIEGTDMMYCRDVGAVVPNQEKWINTLVNRGSQDVGTLSPKHLQPQSEVPDYAVLSRPNNKLASYLSARRERWMLEDKAEVSRRLAPAHWPKVFRDAYYDFLELTHGPKSAWDASCYSPSRRQKYAEAQRRLSLPRLLQCRPALCLDVFHWSQAHPQLYKLAQRQFGSDFLRVALEAWDRHCQQQEMPKLRREKPAETSGSISIIQISLERMPSDLELSDEQKEQALQQGYFAYDGRSRDRVTVLVDPRRDPERSLENPVESGVYETLQADGKWQRSVVLTGIRALRPPFDWGLVIDLSESDSEGRLMPLSSIWIRPCRDRNSSLQDFRNWFESLSPARERLSAAAEQMQMFDYILVGPEGAIFGPFLLRAAAADDAYQISLWDLDELSRYNHSPEMLLVLRNPDSRTSSISRSSGLIYAQGPLRAVRIRKQETGLPAAFAQRQLLADLEQFKLASVNRGRAFRLVSCSERLPVCKRALSHVDALRWLSLVVGLPVADAERLLKTAVQRGQVQAYCRLGPGYPDWSKSAQMLTPDGLVGSIPLPEGQVVQTGGMSVPYLEQSANPQSVPVPMGTPGQEIFDWQAISRPTLLGPDPTVLQIAQQAGGLGLDHVLQSTFALALLQQRDVDGLMKDDLPYFFAALDRLGRNRLHLAYRPEMYRERYGETDLPVLKDMLSNLFKQFADLILMLKEKDVSPLPNLDAAETAPGLAANYRG